MGRKEKKLALVDFDLSQTVAGCVAGALSGLDRGVLTRYFPDTDCGVSLISHFSSLASMKQSFFMISGSRDSRGRHIEDAQSCS